MNNFDKEKNNGEVMTESEMIEVLIAYKEGKNIDIYREGMWMKMVLKPVWDFNSCKYRIAKNQKLDGFFKYKK